MDNDRSPHTIIGRYQVQGTLGSGGFGTVIKAYDPVLKRTVAIKSLNTGLSTADPAQYRVLEERFRREAQAGARIGMHPNVVVVHDLVADTDATLYLIQEYVPGGTLAERIRGGMPLSEALQVIRDAAQGLQAAHEHGIVHRDVKPGNIFLTGEGYAKIGDFGIAQIDELSGRTSSYTAGHPGTPLYMSPEQAQTTGYMRPSSDQYSLGLVLFEVVIGKVYKRLEPPEVAALLIQQPAGMAALIQRMTAPASGERFAGMAEVVAAVEEVRRAPEAVTPRLVSTPVIPASQVPTQLAAGSGLPPAAVVPPVAASRPRYGRRAVLIGGTVVLAAGAAGIAATAFRDKGAVVITATPAPTIAAVTATAPAVVAAAASVAPAATPPLTTATAMLPTPNATDVPPIATASIAPTATPVPPTATPVPPTPIPPTVTSAPPTNTPVPTALPETAPGTILEQNGTWKQGGWEVNLKTDPLTPDGFAFTLQLKNMAQQQRIINCSNDNLNVSTNKGNQLTLEAGYTNYSSGDAKFTIKASASAGDSIRLPSDMFQNFKVHGNLSDPALTAVVIILTGVSSIVNAKWKIPVYH